MIGAAVRRAWRAAVAPRDGAPCLLAAVATSAALRLFVLAWAVLAYVPGARVH